MVAALRRERTLRADLVELLYAAGGVALGLPVPILDVGFEMLSFEAAALLAGPTEGLLALIAIVFTLHPMVRRRLLAMLELLLSIAPDERRSSIEQRIVPSTGG